jgi:hypothetical protein
MNTVGVTSAAASTAAVTAFAAVTASIIAMDRAVLEAAKNYESLGLAFKFAYGNAARANKEFQELVAFADRTPFETATLARYSLQLNNVTSGLFGATKHIELMSGALAKAQLLGKDKAFVNSLGRIISAFQTGSGQIKRYTQTLLNTGAITAQTAIKIKDLSRAGGSAADVIQVLTEEFKKSEKAAFDFSRTTEGLESTLKSKREISTAGLAGDGGLENYKLILGEINALLTGIRDTDAFKELASAFGDLNAEILDLIRTDGFKAFVVDTITLIRVLTRAVAALVKGLALLSTVYNSVPDMLRNPIGNVSNLLTGTGSVSSDITAINKSRKSEDTKLLQGINSSVSRSANVLDPDRDAGVEYF